MQYFIMKVTWKDLIRWTSYGLIFAIAMYCIYRVIDSFGVQYTEPETIIPIDSSSVNWDPPPVTNIYIDPNGNVMNY